MTSIQEALKLLREEDNTVSMDELIKYIVYNYPGAKVKDDVALKNDKFIKIPIKEVCPKTSISDGSVNLYLNHKRNWRIIGFECTNFLDSLIAKRLADFAKKLKSALNLDRGMTISNYLSKTFTKNLKNILSSTDVHVRCDLPNSTNPVMVTYYDTDTKCTITFFITLNADDMWIKGIYPIEFSGYPYSFKEVDNNFEKLEDLLITKLPKLINAVDNYFSKYNIDNLTEKIHIKVSDVIENKPFAPNAVNLSTQVKKDFEDFLLMNFEKELRVNDLSTICRNILLKNAAKNFNPRYSTNVDFGFLYAFFLEELNINLFKKLPGKDLKAFAVAGGGYLILQYSDTVLIPEEVTKLDVSIVIFGKAELEEGITSLGNLNSKDNGFSVISLPSSYTADGKSLEEDCGNLLRNYMWHYLEFTPVKDENGELVSPFILSRATYEALKERFKVKN